MQTSKGEVMKVFGREPTVWLAAISGLLSIVVTFGWDGLSAEQASLIVLGINAVFGAWAAWETRPIVPQVFTYAVTSLFAVGAAYGLDVSQETVGAINVALVAVLALLTRSQVSPVDTAPVTGVLGNKVTTDGLASTSGYRQ
jgi:hypothetical protein